MTVGMKVFSTLERELTSSELYQAVRVMAEAYRTDLLDAELWELMTRVFPSKVKGRLVRWAAQYEGHEFASALAIRYDPGEKTVKYHLTKAHLSRPDEVSLFEFVVDSNRLDFGRVNGQSYAYEIKTELDSLDRLSSQVESYSQAFEHVWVVVHPTHLGRVAAMIPSYCGIQTYRLGPGDCEFRTEREAGDSPNLNAEVQVRNLSSRDLAYVLRSIGRRVPRYRDERADLVLQELAEDEVNELFKQAVKAKYGPSWGRMSGMFRQIHPLDIQAFYHSKWDPQWVYYRCSSME